MALAKYQPIFTRARWILLSYLACYIQLCGWCPFKNFGWVSKLCVWCRARYTTEQYLRAQWHVRHVIILMESRTQSKQKKQACFMSEQFTPRQCGPLTSLTTSHELAPGEVRLSNLQSQTVWSVKQRLWSGGVGDASWTFRFKLEVDTSNARQF